MIKKFDKIQKIDKDFGFGINQLAKLMINDFGSVFKDGLKGLKDQLINIPKDALTDAIVHSPSSAGIRKLGYAYEKITGQSLTLPENLLKKEGYQNLWNTDKYVTKESEGILSQKFKIKDNGLTELTDGFTPFVRRTEKIEEMLGTDFNELIRNTTVGYGKTLLNKALRYSYLKETKHTFLIEGEEYKDDRNFGFLKLISDMPTEEGLEVTKLDEYRKTIYEKGKGIRDYRNCVGSEYKYGDFVVEFIAPKPQDINSMLLETINFYNANKTGINPFLLSSILSFHFVTIHPYSDGNGRMSRFLFQYGLVNGGIGGDSKFIVPVSAYIERHRDQYYETFEKRSKIIMKKALYSFKDDKIVAKNNDKDMYDAVDVTEYAEFMYEAFKSSLSEDFKKDIEYIARYHELYEYVNSLTNIESKPLGLVVNYLMAGNGKISKNKKTVLKKKYGLDTDFLETLEIENEERIKEILTKRVNKDKF